MRPFKSCPFHFFFISPLRPVSLGPASEPSDSVSPLSTSFFFFFPIQWSFYLNFTFKIATISLSTLRDSYPLPCFVGRDICLEFTQTLDRLLPPCWVSSSLLWVVPAYLSSVLLVCEFLWVYRHFLVSSCTAEASPALILLLHYFFVFAPSEKDILPVSLFVQSGQSEIEAILTLDSISATYTIIFKLNVQSC